MPTSPSTESPSDSASPPDAGAVPAYQYHVPSEEKPYHSKRPHKKSRAGCKNCKARKVKCDEAKPACRSCRLRKTECVYPATKPASSTSTTTPTTEEAAPLPVLATTTTSTPPTTTATSFSFSTNPSPSRQRASLSLSPKSTVRLISPFDDDQDDREGNEVFFPPVTETDLIVISEPMFRPSAAVDEVDMRLLWFFTTATCSSFSVECGLDRPTENIMRTKLVQHAFETPFLMHSVFALSTLHLQHLKQDVDVNRALLYRAKSFQGYRKAVEEGKSETFAGLMANSLLLTALSSQNFRDPEAKKLYIVDWMIVWRGIGLMINMLGVRNLQQSGLQGLFYRPPMDLDAATLHIPSELLEMISSIPPDDIDFPEMETYYNTVKYIGTLYMNLRESGVDPIMKLRIITWFTFVPRRFIEIAQEKRPRCLIILSYYAMFLKLAVAVWWIAGIGQRTLVDITAHLGIDWVDLLRIPLGAISFDDELVLSRHILQNPTWVPPLSFSDIDIAFDEGVQNSIRSLCWVDNVGRQCVPEGDEMVLADRTAQPAFW